MRRSRTGARRWRVVRERRTAAPKPLAPLEPRWGSRGALGEGAQRQGGRMSERRRGSTFPLPLARLSPRPSRHAGEPLRPQRPVREAARDARARASPSGMGLDSEQVRLRMVQRLHTLGIRHEGLLRAMQTVPRHAFIDTALAAQAYEDTSLPIGHGQTISKPSVVARMIALLLAGSAARARGGLGKVLEIGTGCGYQCALLAQLADSVISV